MNHTIVLHKASVVFAGGSAVIVATVEAVPTVMAQCDALFTLMMICTAARVHDEIHVTDAVFLDLLHFSYGHVHVRFSAVLAASACQTIVVHWNGRTNAVVVVVVIVVVATIVLAPTGGLTHHTHTSAHAAVHMNAHILNGITIGLFHLGEFLAHIRLTLRGGLAQGINLAVPTGRVLDAATSATGNSSRSHRSWRRHGTRWYSRDLEVVVTMSTATHAHLRSTTGTIRAIGTTFRGRPSTRHGGSGRLDITVLFERRGRRQDGATTTCGIDKLFVNRHGRLVGGGIASVCRGVGTFGARKDHGHARPVGPRGCVAADAGIVAGVVLLSLLKSPHGNDGFMMMNRIVLVATTKATTRSIALNRNLGWLLLLFWKRKTVQIGETGAHC